MKKSSILIVGILMVMAVLLMACSPEAIAFKIIDNMTKDPEKIIIDETGIVYTVTQKNLMQHLIITRILRILL